MLSRRLSTLLFAALIPASLLAQDDPPQTLTLTGILRDFVSVGNPQNIANPHPHFNANFINPIAPATTSPCWYTPVTTGMVNTTLTVDASGDTTLGDNRVITRSATAPNAGCMTNSPSRFSEWYSDVSGVNRRFQLPMIFQRQGDVYVFVDSIFFPLDSGSTAYSKFNPGDPNPFGDIFSGNQIQEDENGSTSHNFGFTLEMHSRFTYRAGSGQEFRFKGDDDVWVFINNRLAIDLGGVHGALDGIVNLDDIAATFGMQDGESYPFDAYFAERHTGASNIRITTSIELVQEPPQAAIPVANPPTSTFASTVAVTLTSATSEARIYYTTDNSTPDSTDNLYTGAINIVGNTTLKAIAYRDGFLPSDVMTEVYTKNGRPSTLTVLDQNGNALPFPYLTELQTGVTLVVFTSQGGLTSIQPFGKSSVGGDSAAVTLTNPTVTADGPTFRGVMPFRVGATQTGATLDASAYDSVTFRWVNPSNPSDAPQVKLAVRPAPKQAEAFFSKTQDGAVATDQFDGNETTIYVFVRDQVLPDTANPTISLVTKPATVGVQPDNLTLPLVAVGGGLYRAAIPVAIDGVGATPGDNQLTLSLNDQLTATYQDPVDTESPAVANAGFGIAPDIDPVLQFVDASGVTIPTGVNWSPAEGKIFLRYEDDWAGGTIDPKTAQITVENRSGASAGDAETFTLPLVPGKKSGSRGVWEGSMDLADLPNPTPNNSIAETYVLGEITAKVTSHKKDGSTDVDVTDLLRVAYPNKNPTITIVDDEDNPPVRSTEDIVIKLDDQSITSGTDTLYSTLTCTETGDVLADVLLIEVSEGVYVSKVIPKTEGDKATDATLQCKSRDLIRVTYKDPVYGEEKQADVLLDSPVQSRIYFTAVDDSVAINALSEASADSFLVVVHAKSPTLTQADVITITLATPNGDTEAFNAVETSPYSEVFIARVPFEFVVNSHTAQNGLVEPKVDPNAGTLRVPVTATVTLGGTPVSAELGLLAATVKPTKAWIVDRNDDGKGDAVYVSFERTLPRAPDFVESFWPSETSDVKTGRGDDVVLVDGTGNTVILVDYEDSPFPLNLTGAGSNPYAKLPEISLFGGSTVPIDDSIAPRIVEVVKIPADVDALKPGDPNFNIDTLILTLSEPIKTSTDFKKLIRFATSCDDYENSVEITAYNEPQAEPDGVTYQILIDNAGSAVPLKGNCIFLNGETGVVTDLPGNPVSTVGVKLEGADRKRVLQLFRGYPPVAGLDPSQGEYQVAVQDKRDGSNSGYANDENLIQWIPPVGFERGREFNPYIPDSPTDPGKDVEERQKFDRLPSEYSVVQVIATDKYVARIGIFDHFGNHVRTLVQSFGYQGEMGNQERVVPKGLASFLVWDRKDKNGQIAGQGVYVWKVVFTFANGNQEVSYTRTGVVRND